MTVHDGFTPPNVPRFWVHRPGKKPRMCVTLSGAMAVQRADGVITVRWFYTTPRAAEAIGISEWVFAKWIREQKLVSASRYFARFPGQRGRFCHLWSDEQVIQLAAQHRREVERGEKAAAKWVTSTTKTRAPSTLRGRAKLAAVMRMFGVGEGTST